MDTNMIQVPETGVNNFITGKDAQAAAVNK